MTDTLILFQIYEDSLDMFTSHWVYPSHVFVLLKVGPCLCLAGVKTKILSDGDG